jgi:hypothetical protein
VFEHKSGSNPEQIYLRVFTRNSPWHAMARIGIRNDGGPALEGAFIASLHPLLGAAIDSSGPLRWNAKFRYNYICAAALTQAAPSRRPNLK